MPGSHWAKRCCRKLIAQDRRDRQQCDGELAPAGREHGYIVADSSVNASRRSTDARVDDSSFVGSGSKGLRGAPHCEDGQNWHIGDHWQSDRAEH